MECLEIRQRFRSGGIPSGASVGEHLRACVACRELFEQRATLGRHLARATGERARVSPAQLAAAEALIENERGLRAFLRSRSTRMRLVLSIGLPVLFMMRELLRQRVPWRTFGAPRLLAGSALLAFLGLVANSALQPLPIARRAARLRVALAVFAWCTPCLLWFVADARATTDELSAGFGWRSLNCFVYGSALASPTFTLLWALQRGLRVSFRVWALAAAMAGIAANLILMLHCPLIGRAHLLTGHLSIGLAWLIGVASAEWCRARLRPH
ncbi:MAG: hypothetical protein ABJB12_05160 [Pseudomonadota bacterium]